jgi:DNA-binding transcriptional regulator GbsR (MarR family)
MTADQRVQHASEIPTGRQALLRFVERFALILTAAGMERMPARVFAYVLAEDADRYTAADLAEGLGVSRAAISGATRALVQAGLLGKEREPGARVDDYRVYDEDVWAAIFQQRMPILDRYREVVSEGVDLIGNDTRGGRRLLQTQAYFDFMATEMPKVIEEWHRRKDDLVDGLAQQRLNRANSAK